MEEKFMPAAHCAALGWCYGRLAALAPDLATPERYNQAIQFPLVGWGELNNLIMRKNGIPHDLQTAMGKAVAGIPPENLQANTNGQTAFALWYYRGLEGQDFNPPFRIADARQGKGWTQQQLADALGVAQARVAEWESGRKSPRPATLEKIKYILQ